MAYKVFGMKHDETIYARVTKELRGALERERRRMSRIAGAEVKTSVVIRILLERALRAGRKSNANEAPVSEEVQP